MEKKIKTWSEVWEENYNQQGDIAKFLSEHAKATYKGDLYIPWALMVSSLYKLDPDASIIKIQNDTGGYVHTDKLVLETVTDKGSTTVTVVSHMVRVKVIFMDKEFEDIYPIQEQDYSASKVFDQNKVNRALQRCMTRVISMATGLAWNLYESVDLQFDAKESAMEKVKETPKATKKTKVAEEKPKKEVINDLDDMVPDTEGEEDLATFLDEKRTNGKVLALVDKYNQYLPKKYTFKDEPLTFDLEKDDLATLQEKVACVEKPDTMLNALRKVGS